MTDNLKNIIQKYKLYHIVLALIFIIAIFMRLKAYLMNLPLWLDECSLAINIIHRNIWGFFFPLEHVQSAPPLFMMLTKLIVMVFGLSENTLRILPLVASFCSIYVFYIFSKKLLNSKLLLLIANFLFAINYRLIYFAEEFKQYASDILLFMLALLILNKIDLDKINFKKAILSGIVFFALFLFSMPVMFAVGGFVLYNLKPFNKNKYMNIFGFVIPFLIIGPVYYFYNLLPTKKLMFKNFLDQWESGFLNYNPLNIIPLLRENLHYLFEQENLVLFGAILLVWGFILLVKNKEKLPQLLVWTLTLAFAASFFNIFPIKNRVSIYIIVPFLICILKPLEINFVRHKAAKIFSIICFLLFFSAYNLSYFQNSLTLNSFASNKKDGRAIMEIMSKKFLPDEVLVYNDASNSIYAYYSDRAQMHADNFIQINLTHYSKEFYTNLLNQLPKGYTYWFYYANDYVKMPVLSFIKDWAKDKEVLEEYNINGSFLMHIKL